MTSESRGEGAGTEAGGQITGSVTRFFQVLLRVFLAALFGLLLGVGLYWGVPALFQAFMEPVEANTARLADIGSELNSIQEDHRDSQTRLNERLAALEAEGVTRQERLSELDGAIASLQDGQEVHRDQLEELSETEERLETIEARLNALEADLAELEQEERALTGESLETQFARLRIMELIARARLEILNENYGLARENLAFAQVASEELMDASDGFGEGNLGGVAERLESAASALGESPVVAAEDLEAAWRLLAEASAP